MTPTYCSLCTYFLTCYLIMYGFELLPLAGQTHSGRFFGVSHAKKNAHLSTILHLHRSPDIDRGAGREGGGVRPEQNALPRACPVAAERDHRRRGGAVDRARRLVDVGHGAARAPVPTQGPRVGGVGQSCSTCCYFCSS